MKNAIISIVLSIFSSFCFEAIKSIIKERKNRNVDNVKIPYSKKYINSIKKEFYISFPLGILFLFFSDTSNEFVNVFNKVMSLIMLFFSLMAFACAIDVIKNFTDCNAKDDK